jgi:hypothetical protein
MAMKRMTLHKAEVWELDGQLFANTSEGPISVEFQLALKRLIPAELMAQYWFETGAGRLVPPKGRPADAEPIEDIVLRFAQLPPAF